MQIDHLLEITTRQELREWLMQHSASQKACWVIVSIKPEPNKIQYLDAVEEALCFGWIDGLKKKVSDSDLAQRLSPRAKKSPWTQLNKERARRLEALGLMTALGRHNLPDLSPGAFVIDPIIKQKLLADPLIYQNFLAFPPLYQRIRIDTIQQVKKDPDLLAARLEKLLKMTAQQKMYGAWHDDGRLLDY